MAQMKTRSDSKLLNLPEEQQAQLAEWLMAGMPYWRARELVEKDFGVRVSLGKFSSFWERICQPLYHLRRSQAARMAEEVAQVATANPAKFDAATIDALKQKAFELSVNPQAKAAEVKSLLMLVLKTRDQDLEERRVSVLERRAAQAEAAQGVVSSQLTPDEQAAKLREIFGVAP